MKRIFAFLMILSLLSTAWLGLAEEEDLCWLERLAAAANELREDVQEAGQEAVAAVSDRIGQASEAVGDAVSSAGGKLEELSGQASEIWQNASDTLSSYAEQVGGAAAEKLDQLSQQASDVMTNAQGTLSDYEEKLNELSDQISGFLAITKIVASNTWDGVKNTIVQKVGELSVNISSAAQTAKTQLLDALSSAQQTTVIKLQELVNWLKGLINPGSPVGPENDGTGETVEAAPPAFFPVSGQGFYFGMTWAEAKALKTDYLNDSRANAYDLTRALVMLNEENTSLYFLWFAGETDDAYLFEVDEFAFASEDTLVPPQDANDQYGIITTEASVSQVYAEKAAYCEQCFGSVANLESGLLAPSLMFEENDAGISQTQVCLYEDEGGVIVVTHFVYTTDCGVNVIVYQHMGNSAK